jgi:hypothetical protein
MTREIEPGQADPKDPTGVTEEAYTDITGELMALGYDDIEVELVRGG